MRRTGLAMALATALLWPLRGRAQEVPATPDPVPAVARVLGGSGWGWAPIGPVSIPRIGDIAVQPEDATLVGVVTMDGTVYLSGTRGQKWFAVLEGAGARLGEASREEHLRHEFDAQLEDALQGTDTPDVAQLLEDGEASDEAEAEQIIADRLQAQAREVADQMGAELQANSEYFQQSAGAGEAPAPLREHTEVERPRLAISAHDRVLVARDDGLWSSDDLGERWEHEIGDAVLCLAGGDGGWWAGTRDGVRTSSDGTTWEDPDGALEGLVVYDLAVTGDVVYAGTSQGLWRRDPELGWQPRGTVRDAVLAVVVDPDAPERVWFAAEDAVYRSQAGGDEPVPGGDGDLATAVDLQWVGADTLVAATADGPRLTRDGGATWQAFATPVPDPATHAVHRVGDRLWVATDQGLLAWVPPAELPKVAAVVAVQPFVPVEALVAATMDRSGLQARTHGLEGRWAATLVPRLRAEFRWYPDAQIQFRDTQGTTRALGGYWQALAFLEWRPEGRKAGASLDVLVSDGQVFIDDGRDRALLAARVDRRATTYRETLARKVTGLYYRRAALVAEPRTRAGSPLALQVEHELRIQETEAQLDALTDGAVSRWSFAHAAAQEDPR